MPKPRLRWPQRRKAAKDPSTPEAKESRRAERNESVDEEILQRYEWTVEGMENMAFVGFRMEA